MRKNYVYVIKDGDQYKIGYSENPKKRLSRFETGNPRKLKIVYTYETLWAEPLEYYLQEHFREKWTRGEWYELTEQELRTIPDVIENIRHERMAEEIEYLIEMMTTYAQALREVVEEKIKKEGIVLERSLDEMTVPELAKILNPSN